MVFNSLGSNYNFDFAVKTLFAKSNKESAETLKNFLADKYGGEVALLYKGREAIRLALDLLNLPRGARVGITGFTCYAVYKAVIDAGYRVEYLDIEEGGLNFTSEAVRKAKTLKALIIQNTFGDPCDVEPIKNFCEKNRIYLIEDLAHSVGAVYKNRREAGTVGDFTALSFSMDKTVDAVSGGALIVRNPRFRNKFVASRFSDIDLKVQLKDRFYPLFTHLIRKTYACGIGKLKHYFLKKFHLLSQPMPEIGGKFHKLPGWYCNLVLLRFSQLETELKHRREIVSIYKANLEKRIQLNFHGYLRFPIKVADRIPLIKYLKSQGIYISDIWYDAPISPVRFLKTTDYLGQCPVAENLSGQIVNLPTHINVSNEMAKEISKKINTWLNL